MIRRPPRSTQSRSSAASDVYKRQNLGYALPFATTRAEVAAFPGRLTALDGQHVAVAAPTFGASRHIASVILAAMAHDGGRRAAMNIRYSPAVLEACRPAGLRSVSYTHLRAHETRHDLVCR